MTGQSILNYAANLSNNWGPPHGDHNKGAVLKFRCLDDVDSALLVAAPVVYSDGRPPLPTIKKLVKSSTGQKKYDWKKDFVACQYFKATNWSYEKEWRVVSFARPGEKGLFSDWPFAPGELTDVFFGLEASDDDISEIKANLNRDLQHVKIHKARIDTGNQSLIFHSIT